MLVKLDDDLNCLILTPTTNDFSDNNILAAICYELGKAQVPKDFAVGPDGSVTILVGDLRGKSPA